MKHKTKKTIYYNKSAKRSFHVSCFMFHEDGFSMFEILVAISIFAVIGIVAAQLIAVGLDTNKKGGQKTTANAIAKEVMETAQAVATEQWNLLHGLSKGSGNKYYPANTTAICGSEKWCFATTTSGESAIVNNLTYTKYFYVDNVSRDAATRNIVESGGTNDPSTQKVTVVVAWQGGGGTGLGTTTASSYLTRSRNTAAVQTGWTASGQESNPSTGEDADFNSSFSASSNIDYTGTPGSIKLQ